MLKLGFYTTLLLLSSYSVSPLFFTRKVVRFEDRSNCKDVKAPLAYYEWTNTTQISSSKFVTNSKLVVTQEISGIISVLASLKKCRDDHCEPYLKIPFASLCDIIGDKNQVWSPILKVFRPPLTCPIKPGAYYQINATLNAGEVAALLDEDHSWKFRIEAKKKQKVIYCLTGTLRIHKLKSRPL